MGSPAPRLLLAGAAARPDGPVRAGGARLTATVEDARPEAAHDVDMGPPPLPGRAPR